MHEADANGAERPAADGVGGLRGGPEDHAQLGGVQDYDRPVRGSSRTRRGHLRRILTNFGFLLNKWEPTNPGARCGFQRRHGFFVFRVGEGGGGIHAHSTAVSLENGDHFLS